MILEGLQAAAANEAISRDACKDTNTILKKVTKSAAARGSPAETPLQLKDTAQITELYDNSATPVCDAYGPWACKHDPEQQVRI